VLTVAKKKNNPLLVGAALVILAFIFIPKKLLFFLLLLGGFILLAYVFIKVKRPSKAQPEPTHGPINTQVRPGVKDWAASSTKVATPQYEVTNKTRGANIGADLREAGPTSAAPAPIPQHQEAPRSTNAIPSPMSNPATKQDTPRVSFVPDGALCSTP
jgi:hypothetical protein